MLPDQTPSQLKKASKVMAPVYEFMGKYQAWTANKSDVDCDFALGNPHEMPLAGFVAALEKALIHQNKDWFAYKVNEPPAVETVSTSLRRLFQPDPQWLCQHQRPSATCHGRFATAVDRCRTFAV